MAAGGRSFTKRLIDEYLRAEGLAIQPFIEIGNEEVIKGLVRLGIGVGIFPAWIASEEIARGLLVALPLGPKPPVREWTIFHRPQHRLNFAEAFFVGITGWWPATGSGAPSHSLDGRLRVHWCSYNSS